MLTNPPDKIKIVNTTKSDLETIFDLFEQAMELQEKNGYKVWDNIDKAGLENDIETRLQYKILRENEILCVFSIQFSDPLIWRQRDQNDAIYLHRIVANPEFKGQKQFEKVLNWAEQLAKQYNLKFVRMDTWADNKKIIDYYKSFGFEFIENFNTPNATELPTQNRNLNVALLEMNLKSIK